jgi:hypothetical protein
MNVTAAMLPGLLSRMGPSLYSPAWPIQAESVPYFSTNTFLDGFQPDPTTGDLQVAALKPGSRQYPYDGAMWVSRLTTDGTLPGFRRSVAGILRDAFRIHQVHDRWSYAPPYTLPPTGNQWQIYDFIPGDERGSKALVNLRSKDLREIITDMRGPGHDVTFMVGCHGGDSSFQQAISVDESQRASTRGYSFHFADTALRSLMGLLGLEATPPFEIVTEVASRIYFSGQYTIQDGDAPQVRLGRDEDWHDLEVSYDHGARDGRLRLPVDKIPKGDVPFEIRLSRNAVQADLWQDIPGASARLIWEATSDLGYLRIYLGRDPLRPDPLMPLAPSLREMLWDGAQLALYAGRD